MYAGAVLISIGSAVADSVTSNTIILMFHCLITKNAGMCEHDRVVIGLSVACTIFVYRYVAGGGVSMSIQGICYNISMTIQDCAYVDNVAPGDVIIAEID